MAKLISSLLLSSLILASPAFSGTLMEVKPDERIRYYPYKEDTIYKLELALKSVTALQFDSSETVESIIIGDSASWEVVKLKAGHVVSIKPIIEQASTNMTIYSDQRVYSFELHSKPEARDGVSNVYRSIFSYPRKRRPPVVRQVQQPINSDYVVSGEAAFRPRWVQDDSRQTTFFLPKNSPRPAIFKVGPNKTEELVNSRSNEDKVIVDGTSAFWVMRIGDEVICVGRETAALAANHPVVLANTHHPLDPKK